MSEITKKTSTELKRVGTISGATALAELNKIEKEYPGVQLGRAQKHDLNNGGKSTRNMFTNYSIFQAESVRRSAEKSRIKIKVLASAKKELGKIVSILGMDEVVNQLSNMEV